MPIEIRELIVKATVQDRTSESQSGSRQRRYEKEESIRECVAQMLEILKPKNER